MKIDILHILIYFIILKNAQIWFTIKVWVHEILKWEIVMGGKLIKLDILEAYL